MSTCWNPQHFTPVEPECETTGQLCFPFYDPQEPPEPDEYPNFAAFEQAWHTWALQYPDLAQTFAINR